MNDLLNRIESLDSKIKDLKDHLRLDSKKQKILELEEIMGSEGFWSNPNEAQKQTQTHNNLSEFVQFWSNLEKDTQEIIEILKENKDESEDTRKFLSEQVEKLEKSYFKNRSLALLSKKYDDHDAIFSIHAGAGGTDAQDWAEMLLRMFLRYCERKNFKTEILELSKGSEAGIKSTIVQVTGSFAYGYLKSEAGVHRLVRLSPFNPAHTRETSFALLELLPVLEAKEEAKLDPKDLEIEANTASGHGGQSVNTTYSAIRITHKPTGLKVSIQNERSQAQNKELALKILQGKLQALMDEQETKEKKQLRGEFKSAEWGNQIRSYILHPYQLVKDHRTKYETSDTEAVLNGELEEFVEKYLEQQVAIGK